MIPIVRVWIYARLGANSKRDCWIAPDGAIRGLQKRISAKPSQSFCTYWITESLENCLFSPVFEFTFLRAPKSKQLLLNRQRFLASFSAQLSSCCRQSPSNN